MCRRPWIVGLLICISYKACLAERPLQEGASRISLDVAPTFSVRKQTGRHHTALAEFSLIKNATARRASVTHAHVNNSSVVLPRMAEGRRLVLLKALASAVIFLLISFCIFVCLWKAEDSACSEQAESSNANKSISSENLTSESTRGESIGNESVRSVQGIAVATLSMWLMANTLVIPNSYDLIKEDDKVNAASLSGWWIGCVYLTGGIGGCCGWWMMRSCPQARARMPFVYLIVAASVLQFLSAVVAENPGHAMTSQAHLITLFVVRLVLGGCYGLSLYISLAAAQEFTPAEEQVSYNVILSIAGCLGLGLGPAFASLTVWSFDVHDVYKATAYPLYLQALGFAILAVAAYSCLPDQLVRDPDADESFSSDEKYHTPDNVSPAALEAKGRIFIFGLLLCGERACIVGALEAATALIFEYEFHFEPDEIGLAASTALVLGVPTMLLFVLIRRRQLIPDETLMVLAMMLSVIALFLVPKQVSTCLCGYQDTPLLWCNRIIILFADSVAFSTAYVASGICLGLIAEHTVTNTWLNSVNLVLGRAIMEDGVGRFAGPGLARYLIDTGDRTTYACHQIIVSSLAVASGLHIRSLMQTLALDTNKDIAAGNAT